VLESIALAALGGDVITITGHRFNRAFSEKASELALHAHSVYEYIRDYRNIATFTAFAKFSHCKDPLTPPSVGNEG
jgi:hypothetical protein